MDNKRALFLAMCIGLSAINFDSLANQGYVIDVPKPVDAQVFASFTDDIPAVVNYFSKQSQKELLAFYENTYGKPIQQTTQYGRLTSVYQTKQQTLRIAISQQNNARQVDVLIEADSQFVKPSSGKLKLIEK